MIVLNVAVPGHFARWCGDVVARLLRAAGREAAVETWPSYPEMLGFAPLPPIFDVIATRLIGSASAHLVMEVRHPDQQLLETLSETACRFLVTLDDPRLVVAEMIAETGADFAGATRAVANCCPLLMRFAALPGALTLHAAAARADPVATAAAIAGHLGLDLDAAQIAQIAAEPAGFEAPGTASETLDGAAPDSGQRTIDGALGAYAAHFSGAPLGPIVWRRELFAMPAEGEQRPTGMIDIAGPPRTLVYGPYIHLPPGRWTARVDLGFSREAVGGAFLVDVLSNPDQLGSVVLSPTHGGVYTAFVNFGLTHPSAMGLEVRVLMTGGPGRGQMMIGEVVLQQQATLHADAAGNAEDFERLLSL